MTVDQVEHRRRLSISSNKPISSSYNKCFQNYYHGHQILNPNPSYLTDVKSTVNHWQLRDLMQVDSSGKLYYTKNDTIRQLSTESEVSRSFLKLDYVPRCFNVKENGKMVVGGVKTTNSNLISMNIPNLCNDSKVDVSSISKNLSSKPTKGLFSFHNPDTNTNITFKLGEMINNAVSLYPVSENNLKSYVCNNDSNLYIIDIDNSRITLNSKIKCEDNTSLNNVCQSNNFNEKLLTVTGDSSSIFLIDPTIKDSKIKSINTNHGSGFGISYHSNGYLFAAAFEDGSCLLYDIRNLKASDEPVYEIKSTRPGHQSGAFRCCKFSNTSMNDLLVVLEHIGRAHLIDLRSLNYNYDTNLFNDHQVIVFPFALDQYANYRKVNNRSAHHQNVDIYGGPEANQFPTPLVYDYDYLTKVNPKLFKNFLYKPAKSDSWQSEYDDDYNVNPNAISDAYNEIHAATTNTHYYHDAYQQAVNNVHGELELCGVDWYENKLYIGCEDGGVVTWEVNSRSRRSFGCYSYA